MLTTNITSQKERLFSFDGVWGDIVVDYKHRAFEFVLLEHTKAIVPWILFKDTHFKDFTFLRLSLVRDYGH